MAPTPSSFADDLDTLFRSFRNCAARNLFDRSSIVYASDLWDMILLP
jgi:hypothetical protein